MSWTPSSDPACSHPDLRVVETVILPRSRDLGGFTVGRVLPSTEKKMVGPFIFFDEMGPSDFAPGKGVDVRPHPHVNLATVTYLFEGEMFHRDSLGSAQSIRPGEINWMTAGRGIVHSERTAPEIRRQGARLFGIQLWVALPNAHEETAPEFHHHPRETLPVLEQRGVSMRLLAGSAYGERSPVRTFSPLCYLDVRLEAGAEIALPDEHPERAVYLVDGEITASNGRFDRGQMLVFSPGRDVRLRAERSSRLMLIGGEPVGKRYIWWNFVSSSKERIEAAKRDWAEERFPTVPGDEIERISLPES